MAFLRFWASFSSSNMVSHCSLVTWDFSRFRKTPPLVLLLVPSATNCPPSSSTFSVCCRRSSTKTLPVCWRTFLIRCCLGSFSFWHTSLMNLVVDLCSLLCCGERTRWALWGGDTMDFGDAFLLEYGLAFEVSLFGDVKKSSRVVFCLFPAKAGGLFSTMLASSSAFILSSRLSPGPRFAAASPPCRFSKTFSGVFMYCQSPLTSSIASPSLLLKSLNISSSVSSTDKAVFVSLALPFEVFVAAMCWAPGQTSSTLPREPTPRLPTYQHDQPRDLAQPRDLV
mmetsp:Transcript_2283/g.7042  ORF Transcript_2283/g.7042 Transcript_2283/m.7042 type:complete len:282 (-) Transcript_2283:74-919(-)